MTRISAAVSTLATEPRYVVLNCRRGMEYRRLRPQSVPHEYPRHSTSQAGNEIVTIALPGLALDPEADAHCVF